jgi:hypothetical protein
MRAINLSIIVPWILTLVTVVVGIYQYSDERAQANRQPFLQRQLELSFQASEAAARLATETNPAEWETARKAFWRLYWGPLGIVEDRGVEAAMVRLGQLVPRDDAIPPLPVTDLQQPSLALAHAVRELVLASWDVSLPPLQGQQPAER